MVADHQRRPGFCAWCRACWWPSDAPPARPVSDAGPVRRAGTPCCGVDVVAVRRAGGLSARRPCCCARRPCCCAWCWGCWRPSDAPPARPVSDAGPVRAAGRPAAVSTWWPVRRAGGLSARRPCCCARYRACRWPSDAPPARPVSYAGPVRRAGTPCCGVDVVAVRRVGGLNARRPCCCARRPCCCAWCWGCWRPSDAPPARPVSDAGPVRAAGRPAAVSTWWPAAVLVG